MPTILSSANNANSLDPDQVLQNISPDLDPNCHHFDMVLLKELFFLIH